MHNDTAFQMAASNIRFGQGITREVGMDLVELKTKRTLVVIDPALVSLPVGETVFESLKSNKVDYEVFSEVQVEPTNRSFQAAVECATQGDFDSIVAVGGGSAIDTAKAANLYSTYPADLFTYVNAPIGTGKAVPGPLKPLIAIPTTAGTGSETTGVAIFDYIRRSKVLCIEQPRTASHRSKSTGGRHYKCHSRGSRRIISKPYHSLYERTENAQRSGCCRLF